MFWNAPHSHACLAYLLEQGALPNVYCAPLTLTLLPYDPEIESHALPTEQAGLGLTVLHVAALHGRLDCLRLLMESRAADVNACCSRGRRPLHMVVSAQSRPHSHACLAYLLEQGALPNVSTEEGLTPLHLAVTEGLLDCTKTLVQVGADMNAQDSRSHTPLDLARIWGHRVIARFLQDAMWQEEKRRQIERCRALLKLKQTLVMTHTQLQEEAKASRESVSERRVKEWAEVKGLPLLQPVPKNTLCQVAPHRLSPERKDATQKRRTVRRGRGCEPVPEALREMWNISPNPRKPPCGTISGPQGVRMSTRPEETPPEPDLRDSVTLCKGTDGQAQYATSSDGASYLLPSLPWDMVQRILFPNAGSSRLVSPLDFHPTHLLDLPHLRSPCPHTSPWTEVAMHLAETLEPGHY
ncbi:ankyrin repeat domain-containing protein 53-like [Megalops cyprinoides]|uniref:ankyrin repeat domain-containing protein 53-like n=1 Tax=Megalops cyprinoides TaxID=118141 RepID=UPI001864B4DE|nr:ankyrin repeat domain-containing protein 53-like [Megalops cyprinoides]